MIRCTTNGIPVTVTKAAERLRKYRHALKIISGGPTVSGGAPLIHSRDTQAAMP
jgi:hypothetical protein